MAERWIKKKETQNQGESFATFLLILSLTPFPAQQWSWRQQPASVGPWPLVLKGAEQILFYKNLCLSVLTCLGATWRTNVRHLSLFCLIRTHSKRKGKDTVQAVQQTNQPHSLLVQKIKHEKYNRLSKAWEEKLGRVSLRNQHIQNYLYTLGNQ